MKVLNVLSIIDTQWRGREGGRRKGEGEEEREKEKKKGGERECTHEHFQLGWKLTVWSLPNEKKGEKLIFSFLKTCIADFKHPKFCNDISPMYLNWRYSAEKMGLP